MFKTMARLWRLLTNPPLPPDPLPRAMHLELLCRNCGQSYQQGIRRLYFDVAASRRYQGQNRPSLSADEVTIPETVICPVCGALNQFEVAASAYVPLGAALLRAKLGAYSPDEPIQFINLSAKQANLSQSRRSHKRRSPS